MRVLFLSGSAEAGGAERVLLDLAAGVAASEPDWQLVVVVPGEGPLAKMAAAAGLDVQIVAYPPALARVGEQTTSGRTAARALAAAVLAVPAAAAYVRALRKVIRAHAPDVIHSNGLKPHLLAAAAKGRTPLVWHLHDYIGPRPFSSRALRALAHRCEAVIANSRDVAHDARGVLGVRAPVRYVYNGIDLDRFNPDGPTLDLDALAGLPPAPDGAIRVGLVATFAHWKGHDVFLRALARLPARSSVRGYVVGGPVYTTTGSQATMEELRATAGALGLTGRVGFTGPVERPEEVMRALDVVVHASTRPEPFGLAIAEAMACGRPAIVSAAGGAAELVADGETALTFTPGDDAALAARITRLAEDPALRARLGVAAREHAREQFDRGRFAGEMAHVYSNLAGTALSDPADRSSKTMTLLL